MSDKKVPPNIQKLIWYGHADIAKNKKNIITSVFNKGDINSLKWLFAKFSRDDLKSTVSKPIRGEWDKKSLNLWQNYFNISKSNKSDHSAIKSII